MKTKYLYLLLALTFLIPLGLCACSAKNDSTVTASGTLSATSVSIAPEISGRVTAVELKEGDTVKKGEVLFRIDDELLQAQYSQAQAGVTAATATLEAAKAQLQYAQNQRELVYQEAHLKESKSRQEAWKNTVPTNYRPVWYYQKSEKIAAAQAEVEAAQLALTNELANLEQELKKASNQDFIAAEKRLAEAEARYTIADEILSRAKSSNEEELKDAAQSIYDLAKSEWEAARLEYTRLLTSSAADAVNEARARVAVAQARFDQAMDALIALQTGSESAQVRTADSAVEQAKAAVAQAEANLAQAKANLTFVKLQLDRAVIKAPIDGVLLSRNLEEGEIVSAGGIVMTIGQLENLELTVYIPEDRYGQISIGQQVEIKVDSFPDATFFGKVIWIADEAEFTPRNVQTVESRVTTVYAVKISVPNDDRRLKPGMPADVTFLPSAK